MLLFYSNILDIFYEGIFLDGKKDLPGSRKKESKDRRVIYYEVQDGNTLSSIASRAFYLM